MCGKRGSWNIWKFKGPMTWFQSKVAPYWHHAFSLSLAGWFFLASYLVKVIFEWLGWWVMSTSFQPGLKCHNYFSRNGLSDAELGKLNPPAHVQIVIIFCHLESFAKDLSLGSQRLGCWHNHNFCVTQPCLFGSHLSFRAYSSIPETAKVRGYSLTSRFSA